MNPTCPEWNYVISCLTNTYGRFGPLAAIAHLPRIGVRHIELPIKTAGVPSFFKETPLLTDASSVDDVCRVQDQLAESGLTLSSCNISSGNPLEVTVVERTIRKLDLAQRLGVSLVVAGAGEAPETDSQSVLWKHLRQIGDAARARGIIYCCETHPGACQNSERMQQMLEEVDHPAIRINFDTGNLFYYNRDPDLVESLKAVAPFVRHVHLKNTPGGFEEWSFAELGTGCVDFQTVREILSTAGFDGPYSLELEGIAGEPEPTLEEIHQRVERSLEHLRRCGY